MPDTPEPHPLTNVSVAELIRRCEDEGDRDACAELDRRGVEPPTLDLDEPPVPVVALA
jgi:hypothetical protein